MAQHYGGLLAQTGQGLKLGGGVLNPDIFALQEQERAQAKLNAEQRRQAVAQFIFQAAKGGMIPSEQAKQALRAVLPELADQLPEAALGPDLATQQAALEFQQSQQDRADRAAYLQAMGLPAGTPDSVVAAMMRRQSGGAASTLGKLAEDYRAGLITKEEYDAARRKATYVAPPPAQQDGFGNSMLGQAYEVLTQVETLRRAGKPIPEDLAIKFRVAQHILRQPQLRAGPGGELMTYTPGMPDFGETPNPQAAPPSGTLQTIRTKEGDGSAAQALSALEDVAKILNEAAAEGETVTGVVGTAKRLGGGIARQAGIPVSPRTERLARSLERLKAIVGPSILQDSRLSDHERKRVEQIVGSVDPMTDDVALRESLSDLAAILSRLGGGKAGSQRRVVVDY